MKLFFPWKMAAALTEHTVGKNEYRAYVVLFVLMWGYIVSTLFTGWNPDVLYEPAFLMPLDIGMFWAVTFLSLVLAYWLNKKGDGEDFWRRYICLDISISVFLALITLLFMIVGFATGVMDLETYGYVDFVLAALFNLAWIGALLMYIKKVSTASRELNVSSPV